MKISADRNSPYYTDGAGLVKVFLAGSERSHVLMADEEGRFAVQCDLDASGKVQFHTTGPKKGQLKTIDFTGDVRIECPDWVREAAAKNSHRPNLDGCGASGGACNFGPHDIDGGTICEYCGQAPEDAGPSYVSQMTGGSLGLPLATGGVPTATSWMSERGYVSAEDLEKLIVAANAPNKQTYTDHKTGQSYSVEFVAGDREARLNPAFVVPYGVWFDHETLKFRSGRDNSDMGEEYYQRYRKQALLFPKARGDLHANDRDVYETMSLARTLVSGSVTPKKITVGDLRENGVADEAIQRLQHRSLANGGFVTLADVAEAEKIVGRSVMQDAYDAIAHDLKGVVNAAGEMLVSGGGALPPVWVGVDPAKLGADKTVVDPWYGDGQAQSRLHRQGSKTPVTVRVNLAEACAGATKAIKKLQEQYLVKFAPTERLAYAQREKLREVYRQLKSITTQDYARGELAKFGLDYSALSSGPASAFDPCMDYMRKEIARIKEARSKPKAKTVKVPVMDATGKWGHVELTRNGVADTAPPMPAKKAEGKPAPKAAPFKHTEPWLLNATEYALRAAIMNEARDLVASDSEGGEVLGRMYKHFSVSGITPSGILAEVPPQKYPALLTALRKATGRE